MSRGYFASTLEDKLTRDVGSWVIPSEAVSIHNAVASIGHVRPKAILLALGTGNEI